MGLVVEIPADVEKAASLISDRAGVTTEAVLLEALQAHFGAVPPDLSAEFAAWDQASDEDLDRFLNSEGA